MYKFYYFEYLSLCVLSFVSFTRKKRNKRKYQRKKRKDALFSTSSRRLYPRSAVFFCSAKAESFMLAIVLRTRSQLAPTLTLPHWGGKNMPSTV